MSVYSMNGETVDQVMERHYLHLQREHRSMKEMEQDNNYLNEELERAEERIKGLEYQLNARSHLYEPGQERNEE